MGLIDWIVAKRLGEERRQLELERAELNYELARVHDSQAESRHDFLTALASIAEHFSLGSRAQAEQIGRLAEASLQQSSVVQSHLDLFSTTASPVSRTLRDADEFRNELERSGFPVDAPPDDQMRWVLNNT